MLLNTDQISSYRANGFLLLENIFTPRELKPMLEEMEQFMGIDSPQRILEKSGVVRSFFAPENFSSIYQQIVKSGKLVKPAEQLLNNKVYIHQSKINSKHAMIGDWWEWHQDYIYWKKDDGMPDCNVLTTMIFLNEVNEYNGPMLLIPGSQKMGVVDEKKIDTLSQQPGWFDHYQKSTEYMSSLTGNLKYTLSQSVIRTMAEKNGIYSAKGPAGSVLFFHGNIFHSSSNNMSPWDRHTFLITYNSVDNTLKFNETPRPNFLANRDFSAIEAIEVNVFSEELEAVKSNEESEFGM